MQLAFGVVGAAIGFWVGGPTGAAYGWTVGSTIGAVVTQEDQEGPRLQDTKATRWEYGAPIPEVWGNARVNGFVMYSTDPIESSTTSRSGSTGPKVTEFSYAATCAIGICEGGENGIVGIGRIWANGELVYDITLEEPQKLTVIPPGSMTVYTGTEDQMPDPELESLIGAGAVPGFRGTAYVVFKLLELGCFGNRLPNFEFEIIKAELLPPTTVRTPIIPDYVTGTNFNFNREAIFDKETGYIITGQADGVATDGNVLLGVYPRQILDTRPAPFGNPGSGAPVWGKGKSQGSFFVGMSNQTIAKWNAGPGGIMTEELLRTSGFITTDLELSESGAFLYTFYQPSGGMERWTADNLEKTHSISMPINMKSIAATDNVAWLTPDSIFAGDLYAIYRVTFGYENNDQSFPATHTITRFDIDYPAYCVVYDPVRKSVFIQSSPDKFIEYNADTLELIQVIDLPANITSPGTQPKRSAGTGEWFIAVGSMPINGGVAAVDPATGSIRYFDVSGVGYGIGASQIMPKDDGCFYATDSAYENGATVDTISVAEYCWFQEGERTPEPVKLWQIVEDLGIDAGLQASDMDVSELQDDVRGFIRTRPMSARAAIENLMKAFPFDGTESDWILKFPRRQRPTMLPIRDYSIIDEQDDTAPIEVRRGQDLELPRMATLGYYDVDTVYELNFQRARRETKTVVGEVINEVTVVFNANEAAAAAHRNLYWAWMNRDRFLLSTSLEYAVVDPTDLVVLPFDDDTFRIVRVESSVRAGNRIEMECSYYDVGIFDIGFLTGQSVNGAGQTNEEIGVKNLALGIVLDMPLIKDSDDGAVVYWSASRPGADSYETWSGADLRKSEDAGASFNVVDNNIEESVIGISYNELPNFTLGNVRDTINTLTVKFPRDNATLLTVNTLALLNGANVALIGKEVIQFQTANYLGNGEWELSDLLRGRRGTEHEIANHVPNETFVLLTGSIYQRYEVPVTDVGSESQFKVVSSGTDPASASVLAIDYAAISLKPYSPVHITIETLSGPDYLIEWVRRSRIGSAWVDYVDAPLGESVEAYEIDIYDPTFTTLYRTLTSSTPSVTYTAAMATEDGAGEIQVVVYQMSSVVGRGWPGSTVDLTASPIAYFPPDHNTVNAAEQRPLGTDTDGIENVVPASVPIARGIEMMSSFNEQLLVGVSSSFVWAQDEATVSGAGHTTHASVEQGAHDDINNIVSAVTDPIVAAIPSALSLDWVDILPFVRFFDGDYHEPCWLDLGDIQYFVRNRFTREWATCYIGPVSPGAYAGKDDMVLDQGAMVWDGNYRLYVPDSVTLTDKLLHPVGKRLYGVALDEYDCLAVGIQVRAEEGGNVLCQVGSNSYPKNASAAAWPTHMLSSVFSVTTSWQWFVGYTSADARVNYTDPDGTVISAEEFENYPPPFQERS